MIVTSGSIDSEFKASYDALFDPQAHLFYRDARFVGLRTPAGKKVFCSRGDGWVYAGLALLIETLPAEWPSRRFYADVFREMTGAILAAQQRDGLWYPNLADAGQVPIGETSGSALFVFGLASSSRAGSSTTHKRHPPALRRRSRARSLPH